MSILKRALFCISTCLKEKITLCDIYQKTITFTYNGRSSYQSFVGGSLSALVQIAVFIIMLLSIITIFQRGKTSTSINTIAKDLTNDPENHYFTQNNQVYFAIKLIGPNPEKLLDKTYLNLQIKQVGIENNSDTNVIINTSKTIDYELCEDKFPNVGNGINSKTGLSSFICPKNSDFFIRSDLNSENFQILQISISKCNGVGCKSDKEILELLQSHFIYIALVSSYFDFNDNKNPVHQYLQDFNVYAFIPNLSQTVMYRIKRNEGTLNDDIWLGVQGKTDEVDFYSVKKDNYLIASIGQDQIFLQINFSLDVQVDQYQRVVFSFLDLFGFIGGLFQIFKMFGFILVYYFANKSFYCSVLSKLCKTEEQMKQFKYSSKFDKIGKVFKDAEENKSSVGIIVEQNSIVPSQIVKVEISDNKISSQNIHEEIKFNDNFNLQSIFDSNRFDTQLKASVNNLFCFNLVCYCTE